MGAGDKFKPLRGLEDSVNEGKALRRSSLPGSGEGKEDGSLLAGGQLGSLKSSRSTKKSAPRFGIDSSTTATLHSEPVPEKVVLFEPEPRLRVALKRTFAARGIEVLQFHVADEVRAAVQELLSSRSFFITILDGSEFGTRGVEVARLLRMIKDMNRFLPVAVIHSSDEKPAPDHLLEPEVELRLVSPMIQPGQPHSEESVQGFVEEVVEFAEESLADWRRFASQQAVEIDPGTELYRLAEEEAMTRRMSLLENLIGELSESHDLESVAMTLLRVAAEYVDRGVLFVPEDQELVAIAGFGTAGIGEQMYRRVKGARFSKSEPSVLSEVLEGKSHQGKLRRTAANESLIGRMGDRHPTSVIVLPLKNEERVVGVFYGDNAEHHGMIGDPKGLELFFASAGRALEGALLQSRSLKG